MRKIVVAEVGGRKIQLTLAQADALKDNGFAHWIGFRRMKITARFEAFTKLRGLSAKVGEVATTKSSESWVKAFIGQQFDSKLRATRRA